MNRSFVIEDLLRSAMHSNITNNKILKNVEFSQPRKLSENIREIAIDLDKSYGLRIDDFALIYLASIVNYIQDKKDALVISAWLAYTVKALFLFNPEVNLDRTISINLLKDIPLLSKEMIIHIWCAQISDYALNRIETKQSLHYTTYL